MITICFTGHRPNKLGGYNWNTPKNQVIMKELKKQIVELVNDTDEKQFHFITGGALGIDQMAFNIVNDIKYNTLKLDPICILTEIAIPFMKQDIKWSSDDSLRWRIQLNDADKITRVDTLENYKIKGYTEDIYYPAKMQKRNEYMVDNSDIVIAVYDDTKGGTANCVNYAKKKSKQIIFINPKDIE